MHFRRKRENMETDKTFWITLLFAIAALGLTARAEDKVELASVTVNVKSVVGGNPVQGTVTLNRPADEDIEVSLAADPPDSASLEDAFRPLSEPLYP
jgi:hypothetical protein